MKPFNTTRHQAGGSNLAPRVLIRVAVLFFVFLAQVFPASADHNIGGSGAWVEICGDGSTYLAQIDEDGNKHPSVCDHCVFCLVPVSDLQTLSSGGFITAMTEDFTLFSYSIDRASRSDTPEQYWSACRGPPIASIENTMTSTTSLTLKEPIGSVVQTGVFPCV